MKGKLEKGEVPDALHSAHKAYLEKKTFEAEKRMDVVAEEEEAQVSFCSYSAYTRLPLSLCAPLDICPCSNSTRKSIGICGVL